MKKVEITLYSFDELSDKAKENAINDNRESYGLRDSSFIGDEYMQTFKAIEDKLSVKIIDIESHGYRRFRMIEGWQDIDNESKYLIRYLNHLSDKLHKGKYYSTPMHKDKDGNWRYKHKYSLVLSDNYSCCLTGTYCDRAIEDAMNNRYEYVRKDCSIYDFVNSILDEFSKDWERDCNYCFTDENIKELLVANECMFTESGGLFDVNCL